MSASVARPMLLDNTDKRDSRVVDEGLVGDGPPDVSCMERRVFSVKNPVQILRGRGARIFWPRSCLFSDRIPQRYKQFKDSFSVKVPKDHNTDYMLEWR